MRPLQRLLRRRLECLPNLRLQREGLTNGRHCSGPPKPQGRLDTHKAFLGELREWERVFGER